MFIPATIYVYDKARSPSSGTDESSPSLNQLRSSDGRWSLGCVWALVCWTCCCTALRCPPSLHGGVERQLLHRRARGGQDLPASLTSVHPPACSPEFPLASLCPVGDFSVLVLVGGEVGLCSRTQDRWSLKPAHVHRPGGSDKMLGLAGLYLCDLRRGEDGQVG